MTSGGASSAETLNWQNINKPELFTQNNIQYKNITAKQYERNSDKQQFSQQLNDSKTADTQQITLTKEDYPYIMKTLAQLDDKNINCMERYTLYTQLVDFVWIIGPNKEFRDSVWAAIDQTDVIKNYKTYFTLAG